MLNKAKHKTKLTQNMKAKHASDAKTKTRRGEREKVNKLLRAFFPSTLWKNFFVLQTLDPAVRGKN